MVSATTLTLQRQYLAMRNHHQHQPLRTLCNVSAHAVRAKVCSGLKVQLGRIVIRLVEPRTVSVVHPLGQWMKFRCKPSVAVRSCLATALDKEPRLLLRYSPPPRPHRVLFASGLNPRQLQHVLRHNRVSIACAHATTQVLPHRHCGETCRVQISLAMLDLVPLLHVPQQCCSVLLWVPGCGSSDNPFGNLI